MKICNRLLITILFLASFSVNAKSTSILVFGDSLSAAYNIPSDQGWVTLLEQQLNRPLSSNKTELNKVTLVNASISGETTSGGLVRFQTQIQKTKPSIVILELGANDGLRGTNLTIIKKNLKAMINISQKMNAKVVLAGIKIPPNYGRTYRKDFEQIFIELAELNNVILIPFLLENVALNAALMQSDGLHPNQQGQKIIASTVSKYLLPLLYP